MPIIINKNKVTGIVNNTITQPSDAVPLSLFNDLSGYVHKTSDNIIINNEVSDLSADVYNLNNEVSDLSSVVYSLNDNNNSNQLSVGNYNTNITASNNIFNNISTLLFNSSVFTLDLSGSTTLKIDFTNTYVSHLLFDNPLSSSNPIVNLTSTELHISWTPPLQTRSAFNFINGGLGINNDTYSYLPFINDIYIRYTSNGTYPLIENTESINVDYGAFKYSQINNASSSIKLTNITCLNIIISSENNTVYTSYDNNIHCNNLITLHLTSDAIGKTYSCQIAYVNNSEDINWQYLTFENLSFGSPSYANPPLSLEFKLITYNSLTISGSGADNPPGQSTGMDASLNLPYNTPGFYVGYGVDIIGDIRDNYIQVNDNINSIPINNITYGYPNINTSDKDWSVDISNLAKPEFIIQTLNEPNQSYYAVNSSNDFSNINVINVNNASDTAYIPIPTRNNVLDNNIYNNYIQDLSLSFDTMTGDYYNIPTARKRTDVSYEINNIYFLSDLSSISFYSKNDYKLIANYGDTDQATPPNSWVNNGSILGIDASGSDLTKFNINIYKGTNPGASIEESNYSNMITGLWSQGSNTIVSNDNISFTHSTTIPQGINDIRKKGYYLGVDLSMVKIVDINIEKFPDICNNNPPYSSYKTNIEQLIKRGNNLIDQIFTSDSFYFNIGKTPLNDTYISNYNINTSNDTTNNKYFWGLTLPIENNNSTKINFILNALINNLDETWAPTNGMDDGSLYSTSLIYNPDSTDNINSITIENKNKSWQDIETLMPLNTYQVSNELLSMSYTNPNTHFSRDVTGHQFGIEFILKNNIIKNINTPITYNNINKEITGPDGKSWWWDLTWNINGPTPNNFPASFLSTITGIIGTSPTLMEVVNVFNSSSQQLPITQYNYNHEISYYTAMWAKNGFYGANLTTHNEFSKVQPYIDYTIYSGQTHNYQVYDNSGLTQSIKYGNNVYYDTLISNPIEYINLKFIVIRLTNNETSIPDNNYFIKCNIKDITGSDMVLGNDYCLFYQEEQKTKNTNTESYYWNNTNIQFMSPWLDCSNKNISLNTSNDPLNTFQEGQDHHMYKGYNNGNYDNSNGYNIRRIIRDKEIYQYLAIGIPNGKTIGQLNITYGN